MQLSDSYFLINDANSTESLIEGLTTQIASSLFSVIVTLGRMFCGNIFAGQWSLTEMNTGVVPIIRCQRGSVAEALATKLDARLRDYVLNSRQSLQLDMAGAQLSRPGEFYLLYFPVRNV